MPGIYVMIGEDRVRLTFDALSVEIVLNDLDMFLQSGQGERTFWFRPSAAEEVGMILSRNDAIRMKDLLTGGL